MIRYASEGDMDRVVELASSYDRAYDCHSQAFIKASLNRHFSVADYLLTKGANIDAYDSNSLTALIMAVKGRDREVVDYLASRGADVNRLNGFGNTPLTTAIEQLFFDMVLLLDEKGCDVRRAEHGVTALHFASMSGSYEIAEWLLNRKLDVNAVSGYGGSTPLLSAAENGHYRLVDLLVDFGAYIEAEDRNGKTPLMAAAIKQHYRVVKRLLDRGANPLNRSYFEMDAYQLAEREKDAKLIDLLKSHDENKALDSMIVNQEGNEAELVF